MNVFLTSELEEFDTPKIESGLHNLAREVVREALRLLGDHEGARARQLTRARLQSESVQRRKPAP